MDTANRFGMSHGRTRPTGAEKRREEKKKKKKKNLQNKMDIFTIVFLDFREG